MTAVDRLLAHESGPTPRADARRNLERLVTAAREAVADVGVGVTAQEVARRAGVGKGTFYRRVPSLEVLLRAVLEEVLDEAIAVADRALENPDPWRGFTEFAAAYVHLRKESCGVNEALGGACDVDRCLADLRDRLRELVCRAQENGSLRADTTWQDVAYMLAGVATDDHTIGLTAAPDQWQRTLRIVLDGLAAHR
ncbi:TetR/AcrR family transcriptional regulator [Nocardia sp. CDC153]|uniref:TetR/AcrR family transcriptional regulator n=1 Tax=Nocardia sp. CDC153 TaxID=3112167 RepID=UPI002DB9EC06|nr:TetR/AcrR family transcriptional regulator [Nocardia sp. CDC153]MEC3954169.1 TetR/AcrR family transcriptional regulator [Nocardia sp. CDC153]